MNHNIHQDIHIAAQAVADELLRQKLQLTAAESCTGGGLCYALTDIPGSSQWFPGGFVTYSNALKSGLLGVSEYTLSRYGAVSEAVVKEMLLGALLRTGANIGIAISGIAGPGGGSDEKPVGTVCFAIGGEANLRSFTHLFKGSRTEVREQAIMAALSETLDFCRQHASARR